MTLLSEILADTPELVWKCDGATALLALVDSSGNSWDGDENGTLIPNQDSIIPLLSEKSLGFPGTGSDYARLDYDSAFDVGTGDFAIEFWCKCSNSSSNYIEMFCRDDVASGNGQIIYLNITTGTLRFWIGGTVLNGATRINDDIVHHIVIERTSGVVTGYVDGVPDFSGAAAGNSNTSSDIRLGIATGDYNEFAGEIQYFAYYTHGLSEDRVQERYTQGTGVIFIDPSPEIAFLQVDENIGLTVAPFSTDGYLQSDENIFVLPPSYWGRRLQ